MSKYIQIIYYVQQKSTGFGLEVSVVDEVLRLLDVMHSAYLRYSPSSNNICG